MKSGIWCNLAAGVYQGWDAQTNDGSLLAYYNMEEGQISQNYDRLKDVTGQTEDGRLFNGAFFILSVPGNGQAGYKPVRK